MPDSPIHHSPPSPPPPPPPPREITLLLRRAAAGDPSAVDALFPLVYSELKTMAERYLRHERAGHTLQTTALVHEAYLRMVGSVTPPADGSGQPPLERVRFLAIASETMRRVLVDHARTRGRQKRGGGWDQIELDAIALESERRGLDLGELDAALERLESADPDKAHLIVLRFFGGLTIAEAAAAMGVSVATANREWVLAKGRLRQFLDEAGERHD